MKVAGGWDNSCHMKVIQALENFSANFEKCGKVFHPLKQCRIRNFATDLCPLKGNATLKDIVL